MKLLTLIILLSLAPLSWGEVSVCEVTKANKKNGAIEGVERCVTNDTIVYFGTGIPWGLRTLPKYCISDSIVSEEYVNLVALKKSTHFFITCIARGKALPTRPE
jgi:hypothetical protein